MATPQPPSYDPRMRRHAVFVLLAGGAASGCATTTGWAPPPPSGITYTYDYQGFKQKT